MENEKELELKTEATAIFTSFQDIKITNQKQYMEVAENLKLIKNKRKDIVDYFAKIKQSAYDTWKGITTKEAEALRPLLLADEIIKKELGRYATEQERLRQIEQRKLEDKAREDARKEQERLFRLAETAEKKGKEEKVEDLLDRAEQVNAEPVFAPRIIDKTTKLEKGSITMIKDVEINIILRKEFLKYAIDNLPETVIDINMTVLKKFIKAMGIKTIVGVKITDISRPSVR